VHIRLVHMLFLWLAVTGLSFANDGSPADVSKVREIERKKLEAMELEDASRKVVRESTKSDFSCWNIGALDDGSALDGAIYYYYLETKELISICAMGWCLEANPRKGKRCECPPAEWKEMKKENKC